MNHDHLPLPVARAAMSALPPRALQRMLDILMGGMCHSHPGLFRNLAQMDAAIVRVEPSDLPHCFILRFGQGPTSLTLAAPEDDPCHANIKGRLAVLVDLLEGRIDGDMMFFSRDLEITGDTAVIVALRNTLDREEINLMDDVTSLCGPFAKPARIALGIMDKATARIKDHLAAIYEERHPALAKTQDIALERDRLRTEVQALKTRLAKFEIRQKRMEAAAQ